MRETTEYRKTLETEIKLALNIDGVGKTNIKTGVGFLDHMLNSFAKHGQFDLSIECSGDLYVDAHHSVEDIGIVLGKAFKTALGDMKGITRFSSLYSPMDESLCLIAMDISGRPYLNFDVSFDREMIGDLDTELINEFFIAFVNNSFTTLHIKMIEGVNTHHKIESIFKGFGRALNMATEINSNKDYIPSTKGVI